MRRQRKRRPHAERKRKQNEKLTGISVFQDGGNLVTRPHVIRRPAVRKQELWERD